MGLIPLAEGLQGSGKIVKGLVDISDKKYSNAAFEVGSIVVDRAIGKGVDTAISQSKKVGNMTADNETIQETIFSGIGKMWSKTKDYFFGQDGGSE